MTVNNTNTTKTYKTCSCKECKNPASRLMEISYIYKKGYFCDSCAIDLSFHGLGHEIFEEEEFLNDIS